MTKKELEQKIQELRGLKALKEEAENELKAIENEIISYMKENELQEEYSDSAKITYLPQERRTLDKAKLVESFGNLEAFEKVTSYNVLRIK